MGCYSVPQFKAGLTFALMKIPFPLLLSLFNILLVPHGGEGDSTGK